MSELLKELAEGIDIPCQLKIPEKPPEWLDKAKFERGREFFIRNPLSVLMSNFRNLVLGLSVVNLCDVLVLTEKSETKKKAFGRYLETGYFMNKWLMKSRPWENSSSFSLVNKYHLDAALKMRSRSKEERNQAAKDILINLPASDKIPLDEDLDRALMSDLKYHKDETFGMTSFGVYDKYMSSDIIFSQFDMAMVQIAFFASVVIFPQRFGAQGSDESFDDFLHMWRVFGYYLGVEDKFNPVKSHLNQTRELLWEIGNQIVIPSVLNLNQTSLHMAKCVTKAYAIDYHLLVYTHCHSHGFELKSLWSHFGMKQKFLYYWRTFLIEWIYCCPLFRSWINKLFFGIMDKIHSKRQTNTE